MREILFRGKRIDNGEWVEGFYRHEKVGDYLTAVFITEMPTDRVVAHHRVDHSTVGQYTGLTDKNGNRIFEGDILEGRDFDAEDGYGVVEWNDGAWEVISEGNWLGTFHENYNGFEFEVIGNIHDNPELLGCVAFEAPPTEWKPQVATNADRIRAMSDEELAGCIKWSDLCHTVRNNSPEVCIGRETCTECILEWLKQPVEDG